MQRIRPVSDLRNNFAEITKDVQASKEPVFLTKNGAGSLVVMSMEAYEEGLYESQVYDKLREAELQSIESKERVSHSDVMQSARARLKAIQEGKQQRA